MPDQSSDPSGKMRPVVTAAGNQGHDAHGFSSLVSGNRRSALRPGITRMAGVVSQTGLGDENSRPVSGGGEHTSRGGRADGGIIGSIGGTAPAFGPRFDTGVPPGGYLWWYLDALSSDGRFAITLIAFVGSVFSPYYFWSGRKNPLNHCAVNIAIYGETGARWAMTERGQSQVERSARVLRIGNSSLQWQGGVLKIDIDEICAPIPKRIRGSIRVTPSGSPERYFWLDAVGNHIWYPIAPRTHVDVSLERPDLHWSGTGYLDGNFGTEPLENGFRDWTWSRAHLKRDSVILYDATRRDGTDVSLALRVDQDGHIQAQEPPCTVRLPATAWRIARQARADAGHAVLLRKTLEDTPFYARSIMETQLCGETAVLFHESLSLDRFDTPIVRAMLPFRMPRRAN